jgi:hypothetical protein
VGEVRSTNVTKLVETDLTVLQMVMVDVIGIGSSAHYAPTVLSGSTPDRLCGSCSLLLTNLQSTQQRNLQKADGVVSADLGHFRAG